MFNYNIILIGFMGAGKSTVARALHTRYDMEIIEMDQLIAHREKKSIPDIFAEYGEKYFRDLETGLLKEMQTTSHKIISCGGGAVLRPENVEIMKQNGKIVLLTATPETILERVKNDNSRPILNGQKSIEGIAKLIEQRREKYEAAADIMIATDHKTMDKICEEIVQKLHSLK